MVPSALIFMLRVPTNYVPLSSALAGVRGRSPREIFDSRIPYNFKLVTISRTFLYPNSEGRGWEEKEKKRKEGGGEGREEENVLHFPLIPSSSLHFPDFLSFLQ